MYKKIEGIIISEYPIEESSKIINIFTTDGIVGVVAKGAKLKVHSLPLQTNYVMEYLILYIKKMDYQG